ncbi:flagellar hook-associated protein FlgL [Thalassoglobus neptunius]|uniref:Flagellar hook-associated protein FlgL n=1 Tax=Thalassoglobus neptunius TaxID=1938619 RepID=A0A5C5VZT6_9PLAN|nr:hypothetical protein [Thalassoglobus neptunius]TWT43012.1 flagellar hook-associated protein FlgL [Thalassoglobus neptunius]
MTFRITPHRQLELQRLHAQSHASRSATLQNQISSGVRVHRPSDDPIAQQTILSQQRVLNRLEVQHNAIQHARASLTQSNEQLLDANQLVVQAKTLALQGRQSQTSFELQSLADEVNLLQMK